MTFNSSKPTLHRNTHKQTRKMLYILSLVLPFLLIENCRNDWVEIPQQSNRRTYINYADRNNYQYNRQSVNRKRTTTESYEITMSAPTTWAGTPMSVLTSPRPTNEFVSETLEESVSISSDESITSESLPEMPTLKPSVKENTSDKYSGFMSLLNSIQQTLTKSARKSLKSKLNFLYNLRDTLLNSIDERISNLWTTQSNLPEARGHDDHEMDFPSNEGALMTIGFLTFAVFLIKLVLKLIHALKNKQNMMPAMGTATTFVGRKKRNTDEHFAKILQYIEEYQINVNK